ncbi:MAG: TAXI family TRAP transporter solute-binding subunit [Methyloceanibacter sp.]|jgi:TRAP transporter TAXI family solute receptor
MRIALVLGLAGLCLLLPFGLTESFAEDAKSQQSASSPDLITIMSGMTFDGTAVIARDLAALVEGDGSLRVVPMIGQGPSQTLRDVLSLGDVDMGVTHSTVLYHFDRTGELGPLKDRVVYVAKLFNDDLHFLAGPDIDTVQDLAGRVVNVGPDGSGTQVAAQILFEALGLDVQTAHFEPTKALEKLKAGQIDAMILIGTTPIAGLSQIDAKAGLKLLPVPYPQGLEDDTYPTVLTHADYPTLIDPGARIDTIGICAVLVARKDDDNAEQQAKLQQFVDRFFTTFDSLQQPPNHPKWREVNFAATLEEWPRASQAQAWIDTARKTALAEAEERESFKNFLAQSHSTISVQSVSEEDQEELFRAFEAWSESQHAN